MTTISGAELLRVVARLNRWATRHAGRALPAAQARLLAQMEDLGAARISDLARSDHCSQPAMTTQVRRLEGLGLAERISDPQDGRAVLVSLTAAGRRSLDEVREARAAALSPLLAELTHTEREQLQAAVTTLNTLVGGR